MDFRRSIILKARQLRRNPTETEEILWDCVKGKKLGVRFRRQHPMGKYVLDFYCHQARLVVEIDGDYHHEKHQIAIDKKREEDLVNWGFKVIRFSDEQIKNDISIVLDQIKSFL